MVTVHFYTRTGCHLCEAAESVLRDLQKTLQFQLDIHDIDTDPELQRLYSMLVPVTVLPDGGEMHYRVMPEAFRSALSKCEASG